MTRDQAVEAMEVVARVDKLLDTVPYGVAVKIKSELQTIANIADEAFPGGYAGDCFYCEESMGEDEAVRLGDERCCQKCYGERMEEIRSCTHVFEEFPSHDDDGEFGKSCALCGYFKPVEIGIIIRSEEVPATG
jgi:hypothetical protein